jgi:pimeloyl-ACP methyl ester carboxylesterase
MIAATKRLFLCLVLALFATPPALAQSQVVTTQLRSASLANSPIGISPVRTVSVYLPEGYEQGEERYPVIYYLGHFFEDSMALYAQYGAKELFDLAIAEGVLGEVIVVSADFSTPAGSSWFVNSSATGNWADFMVRELVPFVDANYRTLTDRGSRGLLGDGVGGYGAMRFAMTHPDMFGSVYAMQAVGTGPGLQTTHSRANFELLARAGSLDELGDDFFSRIFTSIYQAFSPNPQRPPFFFDPPVRMVDGRREVDSAVLARFHGRFALTGLVPSHVEQLKSLRALKLDWGRADTIVDHIQGSRALAHQLEEYGVPHEAEEHAGAFRDRHWGEQGRVYTDVLPFFARNLVFEGR